VVGFPATSVILSRARFCISASHTREDLRKACETIDEVAQSMMIKYNKSPMGIEL
jgi:serine palmitoyltransferase